MFPSVCGIEHESPDDEEDLHLYVDVELDEEEKSGIVSSLPYRSTSPPLVLSVILRFLHFPLHSIFKL